MTLAGTAKSGTAWEARLTLSDADAARLARMDTRRFQRVLAEGIVAAIDAALTVET